MTDISSFIKLSPKEAVLDSWEVVDDKGTPTIGEILMGVITLVVVSVVLHYAVGKFLIQPDNHSRDDREQLDPIHLGSERQHQEGGWLNAHGLGFLKYVVYGLEVAIPAVVLAWLLFTRPRLRGQLCLTNWRLLYYAHGKNRFRTLHYAGAADLEDVLGIHTFYTQNLFGNKMLHIQIHTRFREEFFITAGLAGSIFGKIPWIGKLFLRNTLGKDAFEMLPVLYAHVHQRKGASVGSSLTY